MKRREFLAVGLSGVLAAAGCRRAPPTRRVALEELVREVLVPDTAAVLATSNQLERTANALHDAPSVATLRAARVELRAALVAWKGAQCFRQGPMVEANAFVRAYFWPVRPRAIDEVLQGSGAVDDTAIANMGADARGLYALEYLLFPLDRDEAACATSFTGEAGKRQRELCRGLAASVVKYASDANRALGDGAAYAARFSQDAQLGLSTLVNQMVGTVENLTVHRLSLVLGLAENRLLKAQEVEGWPSGTSQEIALAQLSGAERQYRVGRSGGLAELTSAAAPAVAKNLSEKYAAALAAVRVLDAPLELVAVKDRDKLLAAAAATKALELAIKVELASVLGVTITFQAGDGD